MHLLHKNYTDFFFILWNYLFYIYRGNGYTLSTWESTVKIRDNGKRKKRMVKFKHKTATKMKQIVFCVLNVWIGWHLIAVLIGEHTKHVQTNNKLKT